MDVKRIMEETTAKTVSLCSMRLIVSLFLAMLVFAAVVLLSQMDSVRITEWSKPVRLVKKARSGRTLNNNNNNNNNNKNKVNPILDVLTRERNSWHKQEAEYELMITDLLQKNQILQSKLNDTVQRLKQCLERLRQNKAKAAKLKEKRLNEVIHETKNQTQYDVDTEDKAPMHKKLQEKLLSENKHISRLNSTDKEFESTQNTTSLLDKLKDVLRNNTQTGNNNNKSVEPLLITNRNTSQLTRPGDGPDGRNTTSTKIPNQLQTNATNAVNTSTTKVNPVKISKRISKNIEREFNTKLNDQNTGDLDNLVIHVL